MNADSLAVVEYECVEHLLPVSHAANGIASSGISGLDGQVEDLDGRSLVGEVAPDPSRPAEPRVERLDGVGGVDHRADLGGEGEERDELLPGVSPQPDDCLLYTSALAEAERRIFEHPGYLKYNDQRAFQRSINAVFTANGTAQSLVVS